MVDAARFLGFAFANADYLFEVDGRGTVVFATGAARDFVPGADPVGRPAARLFSTAEAVKFATLTKALGQGDRAGPFRLKLAGGTDVQLAMFRLPGKDGPLCCTLSKPGVRGVEHAKPQGSLATRAGFLAAAAELVGEDDALALVDLPQLPAMCAKLNADGRAALVSRIGGALSKAGAKTAGQLSPSRFGLIADAAGGMEALGRRIRAALTDAGEGKLVIAETLIALKGRDISPAQRDLVVRYVVDKFADGRWDDGEPADIAAQFDRMMDATQSQLRMLTGTVASGDFGVVYQPIVKLEDGALSHYEALARFSGQNTQDTITFIEALGVSDALDLAVAFKIVGVAESKASHGCRIAFNISGKTICSPANFGLLAGFLTRKRALAPRLLIEITETAEIIDLEAAGKAVAALRAMGFRVGIDDFGAGAASINYLHALAVDFVKFDGALVAKIGQSKRDDTLLTGMVKLCTELGIETVAERLETAEQAAAAKAMGFTLGQGWFYGKGEPEIPAPAPKIAARRKGARDSWE
ncbi:MAG TPA: EAL domain-containing protein [Rhizomicrobium sp.]|jgi:EAL domain-containing protein (putative c-di-GMP-specific phosphodiesterase class I)|nr:EAL domain-containing protein [Rhizomicrobium sp.]